jgi:parallel beta-helix repeat protein
MDRRAFTKSMVTLFSGAFRQWQLAMPLADYSLGAGDRFNVRDFGAVGNGDSDDTHAFELALARAGKQGGTVLVPKGRFLVRRPIHLLDGVSLQGEGEDSVIYRTEGEALGLACIDRREVVIDNLALSGLFAFGVLLERSTKVAVTRCRISGARLGWLSSGYSGGIFLTLSDNVTLADNRLSANGLNRPGVLTFDIQVNGFGEKVSSSGIRITRNHCESVDTQCCIAAYDTRSSEISDNVCSGAKTGPNNNNGYGIMIYQTPGSPGSCTNNKVLRNRVSRTGGSAIYLQKCDHSRVANNEITNSASVQRDETLPVGGIALNGSQYVTVAGNTIGYVGKAGISVASNREGVGHVIIDHNRVHDAGGMGIHLRGVLTDVKVTNNVVERTRGGIGGYTSDPQDLIVISDNRVSATSGSSPGIILANGARSNVKNNHIIDSGGYGLALTFRDAVSVDSNNEVSGSGRAFGGQYPNTRISRASLPAAAK